MRDPRDDATTTSSTLVALIDDHEIVDYAVEAAVAAIPRLRLAGSARTVDDLLARRLGAGLVLLDLRLADGSSPAANIRRLRTAGSQVLAFTSGESPYLMRLALQSDVLGVVRKSEPLAALVHAIELASAGRPVVTGEWAHAIETDPAVGQARLSAQEARVLTRFADGARAQDVAEELHITVGTLEDYVRRIRAKYADVGRPATTKVDLFKRAVEDGLLPGPTLR
ncbi:LuxR C-terminal-related transcriptional regulator [Amnibacterium endophyticum]|uniref:LuxR C-terminal-related transcriptional regulator n=1 Tax=Amnibacterium endophyticum TaxID=2109337 RepID=A0ABW4L9J6_9MICO